MITDILILYCVFSFLFMIGYVNTDSEDITFNLITHIIDLVLSPIMFLVILGYRIGKIYKL